MNNAGWISVNDTYDRMLKLAKSEKFLKMQGLNNEVPFFVCPHPPNVAVEMNSIRKNLVKKLAISDPQVQVLEIDLYDIALDILDKDDDLEYLIENEPSIGKEKLLQELHCILDAKTSIIPAIAERMKENDFDVMFISGVGEVFPYIRSSHVLENLQSTAKEQPTVMFFPGEYTHSLEFGASLTLFGKIQDNNYYRAFNIFNCEV